MMIRKISTADDRRLAEIIRATFGEFNVPTKGTAYDDPTTDQISKIFEGRVDAVYFVATEGDVLLGGCGIYPTEGLPNGYAEVVKLYLSPLARGKKLGKKLLVQCIEWAAQAGYKKLYLESFPEFNAAVAMYENLGFTYLEKSLGESVHDGCTIWMEKIL